MIQIEIPEEDSPDLADAEVARAVDANDPEHMVTIFRSTVCPTCQGKVLLSGNELRRRSPYYYARLVFVCQDGHEGSLTFRASFLGGIHGV